MSGKTSAAVKNRYNSRAYDRIAVVVPKGRKAIIQAAAERAGLSLSAYIVKAIDRQMSKDGFSKGGEWPLFFIAQKKKKSRFLRIL